jgi:hypothetical protein
MHPASFREQFSDEMLWIFDEERKRGAVAYLLCDGVLSLLRQRCRMHEDRQPVVASGVLIIDSGIGLLRILQGGLMSSALFYSVMLLSGQPIPLAVSVRWQEYISHHTSTLLTPSHNATIPRALP